MDEIDYIKYFTVGIPLICAMLLSRGLMPYILLVCYKKRLFDPINSRKLHRHITPRLGGVAFVPIQCCILVITFVVINKFKVSMVDPQAASWIMLPSMALLLCGLIILFIVGLGDDLIGVDYKWKFIAQIVAGCLFPIGGIWINDFYGLGFMISLPPWIGMPLTVFVVVLIINAINLIDGLDGLCSGIIMIGLLVLGFLFVSYSAWWQAVFAFITVGAVVPFFYFNVFGTSRRRRRIFMGDTGSMALGYSIAFLAISFAMNNDSIKPFSDGAIVVAFSTLIVPLLDVARVMFVRWRSGKPIFKPDRNHLHHKLLRAGLSRHSALIIILLLTLLFCLFNIVAVRYFSNNLVLFLDLTFWISFHWMFNSLERRKVIAKLQLFVNL